jgi:hypothetical protein
MPSLDTYFPTAHVLILAYVGQILSRIYDGIILSKWRNVVFSFKRKKQEIITRNKEKKLMCY